MKPIETNTPKVAGALWTRSDEDNSQHPHNFPPLPDVVPERIIN